LILLCIEILSYKVNIGSIPCWNNTLEDMAGELLMEKRKLLKHKNVATIKIDTDHQTWFDAILI